MRISSCIFRDVGCRDDMMRVMMIMMMMDTASRRDYEDEMRYFSCIDRSQLYATK